MTQGVSMGRRCPAAIGVCFFAVTMLVSQWAQPTSAQTPQPPSPLIVNQPSAQPALPPMPPTWPSPVDFFRKLLAATPTEREQLLATKTPPQRQVLFNSLREYEALAPEERDQRLAALDLRSYLTPLLVLPPSNRVSRLDALPAPMRPLVEARLVVWDTLSSESQKLVLQNERVMRLVVAGDRGRERDLNLTSLNASQVRQLEADIARWQELPSATREQIYGQFQKIFDATDRQQKKAFAPLNPAELQQMQRALDNFRKLPARQREQCLEGFKRFTELSPEERRQFLLNAEEWRRMSSEDRALWRQLVNRMPPLPPGFGGPPLPPRLPVPTLRPDARLVTTNR